MRRQDVRSQQVAEESVPKRPHGVLRISEKPKFGGYLRADAVERVAGGERSGRKGVYQLRIGIGGGREMVRGKNKAKKKRGEKSSAG